MSNDFAIRVSGLSKEYTLGGAERVDESFREMLLGSLTAPFRRLKKLRGEVEKTERFWALKDVNFEVKPGEVVGIIGRNGAGKSTLLKILSRITDPTEGKIEIRGRISSLLEVGTGFHPELTGRENIFLNGAILGMTRKEIINKFDEIVAFAEVDKFLDTPVKRYSSGMYVRLAFAVAAHLEPEILVVDEVLAVGDAAFQKKCLGKMSDVAKEGRTVLFVSHNMAAIKTLCSRGILLSKGQVSLEGKVDHIISHYMDKYSQNTFKYTALENLQCPYVISGLLINNSSIKGNEEVRVSLRVNTQGKSNIVISMVVRNSQDLWVIHTSDEFMIPSLTKKDTILTRQCTIPACILAPGKYFIDIYLDERAVESFQRLDNIIVFDVEFSGKMAALTKESDWKGIVAPELVSWSE